MTSHKTKTVLEIKDLKTHFFTKEGVAKAVDGANFSVRKGEILGLVGESGSGKSVTGFSIIGLVDEPGRIVSGNIEFLGKNIANISEKELMALRGDRIAMIFQDPMMTLNPVLRIDTQMIEAITAHKKISKKEALERCLEVLQQVGIPAPEVRIKSYPNQLSGGMRQRIAIAIAFLNEPDLIIADEPTTALDVTIQSQILYEAQKLCKNTGTALIWITHDLSVIAGLADNICVMYAGRIVESGCTEDVIDRPMHPYTKGLIESVPSGKTNHGKRLKQIPGMTPSLLNLPKGCAFSTRCDRVAEACKNRPKISYLENERSLRCFYPVEHEVESHT